MIDILKTAKVNVQVADVTPGCQREVLFNGSNLFVDRGKEFLRDVLGGFGGNVVEIGKFLVEVGSSTTMPNYTQIDIVTPVSIVSPSSPVTMFTFPTFYNISSKEMAYVFRFPRTEEEPPSLPVTFSEMGLFYRPTLPNDYTATLYPTYPTDRTFNTIGHMIARLRTPNNVITIGPGRIIELTWKILL